MEVCNKKALDTTGPVIFVAPHRNQFLDAAVLVGTANRPVSFLIAAVSMTRFFIGWAARQVNALPVVRAQDLARSAVGSITSTAGKAVEGNGTRFLTEVEVGDALKVPGQQNPATVAAILSDTQLELKAPFEQPVSGSAFKVWPKLDHSQLYSSVWDRLDSGGAIGVFPEGGSHDNPHFLPLKAGVTQMALGAMDRNSKLVVKIIPCGLNYFHGHRFRSHVMVEYGSPIEVPWQLVLQYRKDKRGACEKLLEMIEARLRNVTLNYPSVEAKELVTLARRLYQPDVVLSADDFLKLERRFVHGLVMLGEHQVVKDALKRIGAYAKKLREHSLRDYEVRSVGDLGEKQTSIFKLLLSRGVILLGLVMLSLPGAILNAPLGLISRYMAQREAQRALKKSEVKLKAQDVVGSYKVIVAVFVIPLAWFFYVSVFAIWFGLVFALGFLFALPLFSYASVRLLEQGVQIWRSSSPVVRVLTESRFVEVVSELKSERDELVVLVRDLVEQMMPLLGPEFVAERVVSRESLRMAAVGSPQLELIGRRTYKAERQNVVEDTFKDWSEDVGSVPKPSGM